MKKTDPPSTSKKAFDCPYCGAYTTQQWFSAAGNSIKDNAPPRTAIENVAKYLSINTALPTDVKEQYLDLAEKMNAGLLFFGPRVSSFGFSVLNLNLSKCFHCEKIAVWVHNNLVYPSKKSGLSPNVDLPDEIIRNFEEARSIIDESPRGAAALLRLCVQKLCVHLGEKGDNINKNIASLVSQGLDPLVQKSLDIIRVIGNEAVHPGELNLNDDRDTAVQLFGLVNSIADQMISHPKNIKAQYEKLPKNKREAIEKRDKKVKK